MQFFSATTKNVVATDRLEYWNEVVCKNLIGLQCSSVDSATLQCDIEGFGTDMGNVASISVSGSQVVNRPRAMIEQSDPNAIVFNLVVSGSMCVTQNGQTGLLKQGSFSLCDARYPYQIRVDRSVNVACLRLSAPALGVANSELKKLLAKPFEGSVGMELLLRDNVVSLMRQRNSMPESSADLALKSFAGMVGAFYGAKLALQPDMTSTQHKENLKRLIKAVIDDNFLNFDLNLEFIARKLRFSKRYLHYVWLDSDQTISGYINAQRLQYAQKLLQSERWKKASMADIAYASGFNSQASFSRLFKMQFGYSPKEFKSAFFVTRLQS